MCSDCQGLYLLTMPVEWKTEHAMADDPHSEATKFLVFP